MAAGDKTPIKNANNEIEDIYTDEIDSVNGVAQTGSKPKSEVAKAAYGGSGVLQMVDADNPMPAVDVAAAAILTIIAGHLDGVEGSLSALATELAQKLEAADLSTLTSIDGHVDGLESSLAALATELGQKLEAADLGSLATTTSVQEVRDRIGALTAPAAGSSNKLLTDILTAVSGTFAYDAGIAAASVDVPTGARVRKVYALAGASSATLTILGGDTITIPAGGAFNEEIMGAAVATAGATDVVFGGDVDAYYVSWTV